MFSSWNKYDVEVYKLDNFGDDTDEYEIEIIRCERIEKFLNIVRNL